MSGFMAKNIKTGEILVSKAVSIHPIMNAVRIHCQLGIDGSDQHATLPHGRTVLKAFQRGFDVFYLTENWVIAEQDNGVIF